MKKPINILLYGPPGAGKGTQAALLVEKYGFHHISTGEVIRDEIKRGTPLGKSMEDYIARGQFAPDDLVVGMIADYLEHNCDCAGNIFDGFPRTLFQAEEFDRIMARHGISVDLMISLDVPDDILVERLLLRGKQSGRADDMSERVIRDRLDIYKQVTAIVSAYYDRQDKHVGVDGRGSVEDIFGQICSIIDRIER